VTRWENRPVGKVDQSFPIRSTRISADSINDEGKGSVSRAFLFYRAQGLRVVCSTKGVNHAERGRCGIQIILMVCHSRAGCCISRRSISKYLPLGNLVAITMLLESPLPGDNRYPVRHSEGSASWTPHAGSPSITNELPISSLS